jgi:aspartyl-tRNA(Asn)/glutamyl-tRNA(Gln) amidotransferase subunit A
MTLHDLTAGAAADGIRAGTVSPVELVEALLRRIDAVDGGVKAWALVDRAGALATARERADEATRGQFRGPLHGVPFAAKDIFYSRGLRTEAGSKVLAGFVPQYDATSIARLKSAGAILLGKLHTTEFATFDPAPTRNPWNVAHTPGGSSSGSAAAVAARMVPFSLGSQTAGSAVRPASYCGLVGLKPTFGRIPARGVFPLAWTQDHVGLMARTVADVAMILQATAGHDPADTASAHAPVPDYSAGLAGARPPRIGVLRSFFFERADRDVVRATTEAIDRLRDAGASVKDAALPPSFAVSHAAAWTVIRPETAAIHADLHAAKADLYGPKIRSLIEVGSLIPGTSYLKALRLRGRFRTEMAAALDGFDVLLTPTTTSPAPAGMETGDPAFQVPWSFCGLPTITVPCALAPNGMPLGIQLIAGAFAEAPLLAAAAWCERTLGFAAAPKL